ncbi:hypothetical protein M405DRAFT_860077 [Rhizopogon salebrosus TDB-379]|nr:hypothetical protein M405DRAFT_860077 [Rhizopogon salebrosus TDB-379]
MDKEKARKARQAEKQKAREVANVQHAKNTPASGSRPSEGNVNPQSGEGAQMQPTPGLPSAGLPLRTYLLPQSPRAGLVSDLYFYHVVTIFLPYPD